MKPVTTTLMDVLAPPGNPWLRNILSGRRAAPDGVQVVRFGGRDEADELEAAEPPRKARARELAEA